MLHRHIIVPFAAYPIQMMRLSGSAICPAGGRCRHLVVLLAALAAGHLPASAQDCGETSAAAAAPGCASQQFRQDRLNELLNSDPARGRLDARIDSKAWIGTEWATAPVATKPSDTGVSLQSSLTHLGSFEAQALQRKIDEAKAMAPAGLVMPKAPVARQTPLDVWTTLDVEGTDSSVVQSKRGSVGADYKFAPKTVVGVAVDYAERSASDVAITEEDRTTSAYFKMKPVTGLTLDARASWAETTGTVAQENVDSMQEGVSASVKGDWNYGRVKFAPSVSIAHGVEDATESGAAIEKNVVTVAPRIERPIPLENRQTLSPFVQFKQEIDVGSVGLEGGPAHGAGAGATLAKPDSYSLSVSTDVEETAAGDRNVKSQLQLKLPLQ